MQHKLFCPAYSLPGADCLCGVAALTEAEVRHDDGVVRVGRETKGRRGKGVTVVTGVPLGGSELTRLARELKKKCGTGGTLKGGVIEIQGDHRELLVAELQKRGWTVKKSGG